MLEHHIESLVTELGLEPHTIRTITIDPRTITVEAFALNEDGAKFIRNDGNVATHTLRYPHRSFFKETTTR